MFKKIKLKNNYTKIILSIVIFGILSTSLVIFKSTQKNDIVILNSKLKEYQLFEFTDLDLLKDMNKMYPHLSTNVKKIIVKTILIESKKYNINPLIIYSLIHTESSMRPWINHKRVLIKIDGKKKYIQAVGLGGIVWEWWGKKLKDAEIAEVRSDLFNPEINIKAVVFVYNKLYNKQKLKNAKSQDESAMIRYFGGGYKSYFQKIDKKIAQLVSTKLYR